MPATHWSDAVDGYCERTDATFWAEPLNAVSNLSFVVAAVLAWRLARAAGDRAGQALAVGAAAIGAGSFLFHTVATRWALQADVWPIRVFVLLFIVLATPRLFAVPRWAGPVAAGGFVVVSVAVTRLLGYAVGPTNGSAGYAAVPLAMLLATGLLARHSPALARGLGAGSLVFCLSLLFR
ncbi:MAG: ceramidase domain-containing protein, partial [Nocardioides sp.]|uniref:hypothetical protein n=1 Tax=Nocardioides sp. TaxID=35761 RepID=UPI0039E692AC